ncbi:MAG TPA: BatA domain-containing protein [Chitinophagaceae bacterium]|nr:BatA domain-containing protein [Chitinophagaceae bacterium]
MLQLVNPIALLALSAVIIPVLIHLWNVRKGKTFKVGSIALLAESSKQPARSRRIANWPLFLLRCLLLLLLAFLLANPFWESRKKNGAAGWVLVASDHLSGAYQQHQVLIDSLLKKGLELHTLSPGFEKISLADTSSLHTSTESPWALIRQLDAGLPKNFPVYLFASNQLKDYFEERPATQLDLHWNSLSMNTDKGLSTAPDTSSIRITIYPGKNGTDAYYIKAALKAIGQYTGRDIIISSQPTGELQELVFWLQEEEPDENILSSLTPSGTLFQYDQGAGISIFAPFNNGLYTIDNNKDKAFYKYTSGPAAGNSIWTLSDGRPLLTTETRNGKKIIHFKSRFNPQWTDLVWQEDFVKALLPFVLPDASRKERNARQIDPLQASPRKINEEVYYHTGLSLFENKKDLSSALWIAIVIVFIAERLLAHHQIQQKNG